MVKKEMKKPKTEKVPLFLVFRQDGILKTEVSNDVESDFELYGFLKLNLEMIGAILKEEITPRNDKDKIL